VLKYRPFVLLAMLLFVLFFACQDDKIIDPPGPTTQGFPNTVGSWYRFDVTRVVSGFTTRDTLTINVTGLKQISADRIAKVWRYGDGPDVDSFFVTESADTVFFFTGRDSDPVTFIMPLRVGNSWHRASRRRFARLQYRGGYGAVESFARGIPESLQCRAAVGPGRLPRLGRVLDNPRHRNRQYGVEDQRHRSREGCQRDLAVAELLHSRLVFAYKKTHRPKAGASHLVLQVLFRDSKY